jgi:hypothetical protein
MRGKEFEREVESWKIDKTKEKVEAQHPESSWRGPVKGEIEADLPRCKRAQATTDNLNWAVSFSMGMGSLAFLRPWM